MPNEHLFGSITLPPNLEQLVGLHRLADPGGFGPPIDGWRAFLRHQLSAGPLAFMSTAAEHLEHFADHTSAVDELVASDWIEAVALGVALRSLYAIPPDEPAQRISGLPGWLAAVGRRRIVAASVGSALRHGEPTPWIVEIDFGLADTSCVNIWINRDGSLYQLYPSDEPIADLEAFLDDIDHVVPPRSYERVPPAIARDAIHRPTDHPATTVGETALLRWLLRSIR